MFIKEINKILKYNKKYINIQVNLNYYRNISNNNNINKNININKEQEKNKNITNKENEENEEENSDLEDMFVNGPHGIEWGGPTRGGKRPEPTRYGDWEYKGRVMDF